MLHDDNRGLELSDIATMLHRKNKLAGEQKLVQSKTFSARDKTRTGQSMEGWRLLQLQGNDDFLNSLKEYTEDHKFKLGGSLVMILSLIHI